MFWVCALGMCVWGEGGWNRGGGVLKRGGGGICRGGRGGGGVL